MVAVGGICPRKIGVVGAGNIGGCFAWLVAMEQLADVVLIDKNADLAAGKALDISQSSGICGFSVNVRGGGDYSLISGADVVVIAAGVSRKPGMSRDDLMSINVEVISSIADQVRMHAPGAFVIVITNPLDAMVKVFMDKSGFAHNMVVGMAGVLDVARFRYFISEAAGVSVESTYATILGGHGDLMVPLLGYSGVGCVSILDMIDSGALERSKVDEIVLRTRKGGAEVVELLQNASAYYSPAAAAFSMSASYLLDKREVMSCSAYLTGQYGVSGMFIGVPVVIGGSGVHKVLEYKVSGEESKVFLESVASVKKVIDSINRL